LRFTAEETQALRRLVGGDDSKDEQAEGWVTGILLGVPHQLGIRGGALLGGYIEREVLNRLERPEQEWLETLAVVETITPTAAERLLGPSVWAPRLGSISQRCAFMVAGDDGSYRLHTLVREALLNRLRRAGSERAAHAWTVARALAEETFDTVGVVRACQELGQIQDALEVVRRTLAEKLRLGRWSDALSTLRLLPETVRRADGELSVAEADALLRTGQSKEANAAAEAALELGARSDDAYVQVSASLALAQVARFAGDLKAAEDWIAAAEHLVRASDLKVAQQRQLEGRAIDLRAVCAATRGRMQEAREGFESAERLLRLGGPSRELAVTQHNLGNLCNLTGDYAAAQTALASAASHWRVVGDRTRFATTQQVLGELYLRIGNVEAAGAALHDGLEAAQRAGSVRNEAWLVVWLSYWHRASGRISDAVGALDRGLVLLQEVAERDLLVVGLVLRAELAILQNALTLARELLERAQADAQRLGSDAHIGSVSRALGRLHLVEGAGEHAISHLQEALRRGGDAWGPDEQVETLYWLGTAFLQLGRAQPAGSHLEDAIRVAERAGLPYLLVGPAAEDPRLLRHGKEMGISPATLGEVERLAATRQPWTGVPQQTQLKVVAENELPRLEAQLFGTFVLHLNGRLMGTAVRKVGRARELLALLILQPNGMADEEIADLMFAEMTAERSKQNVQMAAYSLRHDLNGKATVRYSAGKYQLSPQLELVADVHTFDAALARARGATGEALVQALSRALDVYRQPLLGDVAWNWVETYRLEYQSRYISAALQLADALARSDPARSDGLAESVIAIAPETDTAYERLIQNALARPNNALELRRLRTRYVQAAAQYGFTPDPHLAVRGAR
jgi:tetratricopeptide (TPR) repeat protein